jgi:hypothetical protein
LQLPYQNRRYDIYFDNFFSNTALFYVLRKYGIGACGTARSNMVPEALRVDKAVACKVLQWNDLFGVIKDEVLCTIWQDNNQVFLMTTIHDLKTGTLRLCRRPRETRSYAAVTRPVFGDDVRKLLTIPDLIDDYNHHKGGVDIADQLRSSYRTHLKGKRNWLPLFYCLLDSHTH